MSIFDIPAQLEQDDVEHQLAMEAFESEIMFEHFERTLDDLVSFKRYELETQEAVTSFESSAMGEDDYVTLRTVFDHAARHIGLQGQVDQILPVDIHSFEAKDGEDKNKGIIAKLLAKIRQFLAWIKSKFSKQKEPKAVKGTVKKITPEIAKEVLENVRKERAEKGKVEPVTEAEVQKVVETLAPKEGQEFTDEQLKKALGSELFKKKRMTNVPSWANEKFPTLDSVKTWLKANKPRDKVDLKLSLDDELTIYTDHVENFEKLLDEVSGKLAKASTDEEVKELTALSKNLNVMLTGAVVLHEMVVRATKVIALKFIKEGK